MNSLFDKNRISHIVLVSIYTIGIFDIFCGYYPYTNMASAKKKQ